MSRAALSLYVWFVYLALLSLTLLLAPSALLGLFGFPPTQEVWIRVVGMLLLFFSYYSVMAALTENKGFMLWSAQVRATVIGFFAAFVALGLAPPALLLFSAIDLAAAGWTYFALRADTRAPRP